ncbi:MAG TPA: GNAT family N-acetyltransferase [Burkholderiales bacterium]|nr:GNAT family N-acetyltransferase [Burkholderiales bacterium]
MERDPHRKDPVLEPAGLAESFQPIIGRAVTLRTLRREDHDIELEFVSGLSPETRHNRLLGGAVRITREYIERLTTVDLARDMALAAVVMHEDHEALIGVARYVLDADGRACEFALVIADVWQGRGIGRRMMEKLIGIARARGLARLYGDVLSTNLGMLEFCRRLGFRPARLPEDATVTRVTLAL